MLFRSDALRDREPAVRTVAAHALGRIGIPAKAAVPRLMEALNDPVPEVREATVIALGRMGAAAKPAAAMLAKIHQQDEADQIRTEAGAALKHIRDARTPFPLGFYSICLLCLLMAGSGIWIFLKKPLDPRPDESAHTGFMPVKPLS